MKLSKMRAKARAIIRRQERKGEQNPGAVVRGRGFSKEQAKLQSVAR